MLMRKEEYARLQQEFHNLENENKLLKSTLIEVNNSELEELRYQIDGLRKENETLRMLGGQN